MLTALQCLQGGKEGVVVHDHAQQLGIITANNKENMMTGNRKTRDGIKNVWPGSQNHVRTKDNSNKCEKDAKLGAGPNRANLYGPNSRPNIVKLSARIWQALPYRLA